MKRLPTIATALAAAAITVVLVGVAVNGFTDAERKTIRAMKARMATIEATHAADLAAMQQQLATLQDSHDGMVGDLQVLMENQTVLSNDIDVLDAGLAGLVAEDGPIAQIDQNLLMTQEYLFARVPAVVLTNITPLVECDGTSCTVDVEWDSAPPATGQVEWGADESYGNLTGLEEQHLAYHRQRIGVFPQDGATYHFRVLAELPDGATATAEGQATSG